MVGCPLNFYNLIAGWAMKCFLLNIVMTLQACDLESLNHLEALLTEFYSAITDNAKKKEIGEFVVD